MGVENNKPGQNVKKYQKQICIMYTNNH